MASIASGLSSIQDKRYEEELLRNPYSLKVWLSFIDSKKADKSTARFRVYERALQYLPRSYKLWRMYLQERTDKLKHKCVTDKKYELLVRLYERALVNLHKMPVIWAEYCSLLVKMRKGTSTRKAFDRALQALPITQHYRIWELYIEWAVEYGVSDTAVLVYRRYLMFDPSFREDYVEYLESNGQYDEAARQLVSCIDDDHFVSAKLHTRHEMWMHLCDLCAAHPVETSRVLKVESIIRSGISRFSDEVGRLWCRLADYYIRLGLFDKARDIYEEAVGSVVTVRDFTLLFEAYTRFEESVLTAKIGVTTELEEQLGETASAKLNEAIESHSEITTSILQSLSKDSECPIGTGDLQQYVADKKDVMLRLERLEYLIDSRPLSLNAVVLRQNPHNVYEWHKRIKLYKNEYFAIVNSDKESGATADSSSSANSLKVLALQRVIATYMEAIATIDARQAKGKFSSIWLSLASFYENHYSTNQQENLDNARAVFRKAVGIGFKTLDEQAALWCSWAEMELKYDEHYRALSVMQEAVTEPVASIQRRKKKAALSGAVRTNKRAYTYKDVDDDGLGDASPAAIPMSERVFRHVKVWELYLDLEESLGSVDSTRAAYDRCMDIGVITPAMALSYAHFLEENEYFEDSFRVYERSIALFTFPHVKKIWLEYLDKFIQRYEGRKLERLRDLYEQALMVAPTADRVEFYLRYSKTEELYGLARHALTVYDRATKDALITDDAIKFDLFRLYIKKSSQFYGATKTRPIYERAIKELGDETACRMCIEFSTMECKLGEVDRARAIFQHGSQLVDPKHDKVMNYWSEWKNFEELHGNENTFRDMLRMRRSAEVAFSQVHYAAAEMAAATATAAAEKQANASQLHPAVTGGMDAMSRLSNQAEQQQQSSHLPRMNFVASSETNKLSLVTAKNALNQSSQGHAGNNEEIDIDIDMDDDEGDGQAEEEEDAVQVTQKQVPAAVFGRLAAQTTASTDDRPPQKAARLH